MRALGLLLGIGAADLIATAVLSADGRFEERNPLMAGLLAHGPWPFVMAKTTTLVVAGLLLARQDRRTMRRACLLGSGAYLTLLALAFWG